MNISSDLGPVYHETNMENFPVEPWNTVSNLIFLAIFLYWAYRIKGNIVNQYLVALSLPFLFIGWVGGTIFHATRSHELWLYMDFLPIYFLGLSLACFYWYKITESFFKVVAFTVVPYLTFNLLTSYLDLPQNFTDSSVYFFIFVIAAFPLLRYAIGKPRSYCINLIYAITCFCFAIIARITDKAFIDLLPMGTHWLWHIGGGFCTFFMFKFVYEDHEDKNLYILIRF